MRRPELLIISAVMLALTPALTGAAAAVTPSAEGISLDLNALVGGGAGAATLGLLYYVFRVILDRTVPSRSDARANVSMLLEGLQGMVKILQEEKEADAKRLSDRQARIDALENEADINYARKAEMQAEIIDLRSRLAQKERHIKHLLDLLRQLGAEVPDPSKLDAERLEITLPGEKARQIVANSDETR